MIPEQWALAVCGILIGLIAYIHHTDIHRINRVEGKVDAMVTALIRLLDRSSGNEDILEELLKSGRTK